MNTAYAPWPTATVSTALGPIALTVTDADYIHAHPTDPGSSLTVTRHRAPVTVGHLG